MLDFAESEWGKECANVMMESFFPAASMGEERYLEDDCDGMPE